MMRTTPTAGRAEHDDPNARPGIRERYSAAIGHGGARDVILAAGMAGEQHALGLAMIRLASEFDTIRGEIRRASSANGVREASIAALRREAARCEADAARLIAGFAAEDREIARLRARAEDMRRQADLAAKRSTAEIVSERADVLQRMKTLADARRQVAARAHTLNAKRGSQAFGGAKVLMLAGRVIDVFLDEVCEACDGTGMTATGYAAGARTVKCKKCDGEGHRRNVMGDGPSQHDFAAALLDDLQQRVKAALAAQRAALMVG